jgi:amphi-Trp domain-containing protein
MADVKIERKQRLSRQEAGERLIALGRALAGGSTVEWESGDDSISFAVADEVAWEFELEVDGDGRELEIELTWTTAAPAARPRPATRTRRRAA